MTSTTERTGTAEDVERLARDLMGWESRRSAVGTLFWRDPASGWTVRQSTWSPFTSADADVQILERVREVWKVGSRERDEFRSWIPPLDLYRTGDWSIAALAVLKEMEKKGR